MRFVLPLLIALAGCRGSTPTAIPDPTPNVPPSPSPSPTPLPEVVCEPYVTCGMWSACTFFEHLDTNRWRATSGPMKGTTFLRSHQCWPADAGPAKCALYCSGPGPTDGTCVDGLMSEMQICTESAPPHPSEVRCEIREGQCVQAK